MASSSIVLSGAYFPPHSKSKEYSARNQATSLFQRCKSMNDIPQIHSKIIRTCHNPQDPFLLFELLRHCAKYHSMDYASRVFQYIENPNVYLYTALIDGYILSSSYLDAIAAYAGMICGLVKPDPYVISSVLKACAFQLALQEGEQLHCQVLKLQLCSNRSIRMKLLELYGKCGEFGEARRIFDELPDGDVAASTIMVSCLLGHGLVEDATAVFNCIRAKDTICWTAMINGFVRNGEMNKALELFRKMQKENVRPNEVTVVCVLTACAQLGALELGGWVHSYISKHNIKLNHFVGSALISMYSKCGSLDEAERVFKEIDEKVVVTYNSMIVGFGMHGKSTEALRMFQSMVMQGLRPNHITFVGVLNACSHAGLVDLGLDVFQSMDKDYGVEPRIEHYGCIVDLLGRVGRLEEAFDFVRRMKVAPDHIMLGSLLSACKTHGNLELGQKVAEFLIRCDMADSGTYVLLSNAYASAGRWEEAALLRAKMKKTGILKEPGCSSIEVKNEIHEFLLGDIRHHQREEIYGELEELIYTLKSEGYSPATDQVVLHDIEDQEKEHALAIHSERLALCYGLISTEPGTPIRVVNNLRICNDCHTMFKLVAQLKRRKIIVRDRNRFHHFADGSCSCGDYW